MPGRHYMNLLEVAIYQYGYVTVENARERGIDPTQLRLMHHRGLLERIAHGVYRFPVVPTTALDQYIEAVLWVRTPAALCHETAMDLHELCDLNPERIHVNVQAKYRARRNIPTMYRLHQRNLESRDLTLHEGIPIVTVPRAILDGIEIHLGAHLIDQAVEAAQRRGLLTLHDLKAIHIARDTRSLNHRL